MARKIGGTRIYMPAQEFLWNTSSGVGAGDLKRLIATRLSLPLHDVLIAKYNQDVCEWTVLRDQPQVSKTFTFCYLTVCIMISKREQ